MASFHPTPFFCILAGIVGCALAKEVPVGETTTQLDKLIVYGRDVDMLGDASSASEGQVGAADLTARLFCAAANYSKSCPDL